MLDIRLSREAFEPMVGRRLWGFKHYEGGASEERGGASETRGV